MSQFSDTTNDDGLIQKYEKYTRQPYQTLTGDSLREATDDINESFEDLMPLLLQFEDQLRWDDLNHTDAPIGTANIVSLQEDYKITVDDNSLDILNVTNVRILPSSSATGYVELERMTLDDSRVPATMAPDGSTRGVPTHFLEVGNTIYLYPEPNYAATNGLQIFFQREQSYFASSDTTKEPGIAKPFHSLLAYKAALRWIERNRSDDTNYLTTMRERIAKKEKELRDFVNARHPSRARMTPTLEDRGAGGGSPVRFST